MLVGAAGDFLLKESTCYCLLGPSECVDLRYQTARALLELVRQVFDVIASGQRVGCIYDSRLVSDDLLSAERQRRCFSSRKRERLIVPVGVQRLRPAQRRSKRLDCDTNYVVQGLLRSKRHSASLSMEPKTRACIGRVEPLTHYASVESSRRSELRDLLE